MGNTAQPSLGIHGAWVLGLHPDTKAADDGRKNMVHMGRAHRQGRSPRVASLGERRRQPERNQSYSLVSKSPGTEQSKAGQRGRATDTEVEEQGELPSARKGRCPGAQRPHLQGGWGRGPSAVQQTKEQTRKLQVYTSQYRGRRIPSLSSRLALAMGD